MCSVKNSPHDNITTEGRTPSLTSRTLLLCTWKPGFPLGVAVFSRCASRCDKQENVIHLTVQFSSILLWYNFDIHEPVARAGGVTCCQRRNVLRLSDAKPHTQHFSQHWEFRNTFCVATVVAIGDFGCCRSLVTTNNA